MKDTPASRPPLHFWIVAVIAVLWNAVGAFDFVATQIQLEAYMSAFSDQQLAFFYGVPAWAVATWGIATFSALFGSVAMLLRLRRAYELFIISFIAMLMTSFQNFVLSNGAEVMGTFGLIFSGVIVAIGIFLIIYNRAMLQRGVLR